MERIETLSQPAFACATLDATIEELEAVGARFFVPVKDGTWDEAGPIRAAFVRLGSGVEVLLVAVGDLDEAVPELGIEVRAPAGTRCREVAQEILGEIGGSDRRITWIRPKGWPGEIDET